MIRPQRGVWWIVIQTARGRIEVRTPDKEAHMVRYTEPGDDLCQRWCPVSWFWVTFKLCYALLILLYLFLCLWFYCLVWFTQRSRPGHLLFLTGEMNKYMRWRNLSTQTLKVCESKGLREHGYFYSEMTTAHWAKEHYTRRFFFCFLFNFPVDIFKG